MYPVLGILDSEREEDVRETESLRGVEAPLAAPEPEPEPGPEPESGEPVLVFPANLALTNSFPVLVIKALLANPRTSIYTNTTFRAACVAK